MTSLHADEAFLGHYQFSHDPFAPRVPGFKFFPAQRKPVLGQLHHLARYSQLLLLVTGPLGSGKTLLRQALVASTNKDAVLSVVISARTAADETSLLRQVAQGLSINQASLEAILTKVAQLAITGQDVYLMVDDAEQLQDSALEVLLLLASGTNEGRLHVFLFGEPSLLPRLEVFSEGEERFHAIELQPYSEEETRDYLAQRLEGAGQGIELISNDLLVDIHEQSEGWPGAINQVARDALIEAMLANRGAARKATGGSFNLPKKHLVILAVVAIGVIAAWFMQGKSKPEAPQTASTELSMNGATPAYIEKGAEFELVDAKLKEFDLEKLGKAIDHERDQQFTYLGLQTLYDRYFIHKDGIRFELPQIFFMRVAMGLAIEEKDREARAIEFYNLLSSFDYMSSTPTLFNAGTLRPQLSSCYLTTVPDDLSGIYGAIHDNAMLSKFAGGLGNDWTPVRALGSYIKGTNGKSQGVVPFLKVVNDTAVAVNQGGKRKGAVCAYLETWHLDIEEFLELRKNTGDDRRRTHDMNTANWIPDLFMKRVFDDGSWTLFSPSDVPDLHDLYGKAFEERYEYYEALASYGKLKLHKVVQAKDLWRKMLSMLFETGHPWLTFKDPCNLRSPQQHVGVVHSSNLCTEITLNTNKDEIAVCNLGSINLVNHIVDGKLDTAKLEKTVKTAVRMLDNVIDINYYSVPQAQNSNFKHRPVGLGIMGFQDALYLQHIPYGSDAAIAFADQSMEAISYYAIQASCDLADERGAYQTFQGSLWSQGILPIDSEKKLIEERGAKYIEVDLSETLDWAPLRERVQKGIRNSNIMAIAPTATIANITGVSQSIEPTYQNLYVKSNLSGEFTVINPYLVRDLKARGLWDPVMVNDLKYYDGSVQQIERIPQDLKDLYATAFEVETRWIVEAASRRQKWIDQAQSLNLYIAGASGKKLDVTYRMAWFRGLKTTYYLRALAATSTEKSTINTGKLNAVSAGGNDGLQAAPAAEPKPAPVPQACSIDNPDCEACQ
ncbi:ribonucleoside-diphosphate reductase subunit alpha [Pseudomonas aeruginosa]|nr:ribonucleoside-diphosphate reductase subunit alpha [Pseudomonas aeruginosa]